MRNAFWMYIYASEMAFDRNLSSTVERAPFFLKRGELTRVSALQIKFAAHNLPSLRKRE